MKKSLLFFLFITYFFPLSGKQIPINEATQIAQIHQNQNNTGSLRIIPVQLVKTIQGNTRQKSTQKKPNLYYIFNMGNNNGYVIVAADDVCTPIIGYTTEGTYDESALPPNYIEWMQMVQQGIENAIQEEKQSTDKVKKQWLSYQNNNTRLTTLLSNSVLPLVKTKWNQSTPYYNSIPIKNESGTPAYTGCVATTIAQILKYHEFPRKGYKTIPGYTTGSLRKSIPSIDITQYTYDWDNMVNTYGNNGNNTVQDKAVADLMYHCGAAVKMDYGFEGSGAYSGDAIYALTTYFGYTTSDYTNRYYYTDEEWTNLLKSSINEKLPVYFSAADGDNGHAFVCDGFDSQGLFHFNWGWGGYLDGYYSVDAPLGFTSRQHIIYNIKPTISNTYNKEDKEGLRQILGQGTNFSTLGLTVADTLKWRSNEEWVSKVRGLTWSTSVNNKKITKISWSSQNNLTGKFDLTEFKEIKEVLCAFNQLTEITASQNPKLELIDAGYNKLTTVSIDDCSLLNTLKVHRNELSELGVSNWGSIKTFYCDNNKLKFSDLPIAGNITSINYNSQSKTDGGTIIPGKIINLSLEHTIDNKITDFKWYNQNGTEISLAGAGNGKFTVDAKYANTILTCKMTNARFPGLTVEQTFTIAGGSIYNSDDKESLRQFLRQENNFAQLGLSKSDTINWESSDDWIAKTEGLTWINSNSGKRLAMMYFWEKDLKGTLKIDNFKEMQYVYCPFNQLTEITASQNPKLKLIDAGYNKLTTVKINDCSVLNTLKIHSNQLSELTVSNWDIIDTFLCDNNYLKFSDLPLKNFTSFTYHPQNKIDGGTIRTGQIIDLSKEYIIGNQTTNFSWYDKDNTKINLTSKGNGKFIADIKYENTSITCKMTNARFPELTLEYTIKIENAKGIYNEEDKEGLRKILSQGTNYASVGLTSEDMKNWNESEEWVAKINGVTWKDTDQGKRISVIRWWSPATKLTGTVDCSPFAEIEEILLPFNSFTSFKTSQNPKLKQIDLGYNQLTEVTINNCPSVNKLLVHYNQLEKLNVTNWTSITELFVYNNKLRFSTLPLNKFNSFSFNPQAKIDGGIVTSGNTIDLSSEYTFDGNTTTYKWYNGTTEITLPSRGNGKFLAETKYASTLTCKMTNARFPGLILEYTVYIDKVKGIYNEQDKEGLRKILNQGTNYISVGLTSEDLKNWNDSEEWVAKVNGLTWKDTDQGKRISVIRWWSPATRLTGTLDCSPFAEIEEILFPYNNVTTFKTSQNPKLKQIDIGYNQLTEVTINNCPSVNKLLVHYNQLEKLNVTNWTSITELFVYNNKFRFSTLPTSKINSFTYRSQAIIEGGTINAGNIIDLSSEYTIDGALTNYKWYNGTTEITLPSRGNGKFIADTKYINATLTCKMTNTRFPNLTLEYTVYIDKAKGIYNEQDKEGLRKILNQGTNYTSAGLTSEDIKNWNSSEEWVAKINGVTWKDTDQGKRISVIRWWSPSIKLTGIIDCSPFVEIEEILLPFNSFTGFKTSQNPKLKQIDIGYNQLTEVTINNCPVLNTLKIHYNQLEKTNVDNWNTITTLLIYNNKLRFSTLPLNKFNSFSFNPQAKIDGGIVTSGNTIDLSSEYTFDGNTTTYKWYNGTTEITLPSRGNGKFLAETKYASTLTCKMTNARFPGLILEYTVYIDKAKGIYNEQDKEGLRKILNQGTNYISVGLTSEDLKNWNDSEEWVAKVNGLTWKDSDQGKRISKIRWWSPATKLTGTLDCSPFTEIEEILFPYNNVTTFKTSQNPKLKQVDAGYNQLTEVTINNCPVLNTLKIHYNQLEKTNVDNWNTITTLLIYNNKLRFSTLPLNKINSFSYSSQAKIEGGTINAGNIIDLSSEYTIDGTLTNYKWYNGTTEITLTPKGNGKFIADTKYVNATLTCKMTNTRFPNLTLEYTVKISNAASYSSNRITSSDISIYPNPVIDNIHFNTTQEIQSIDIYSLDGKLALPEKNIQNNQINVQLLPSGVYILIIKTADGQSSIRFTKG